jgi:hypothetical protein
MGVGISLRLKCSIYGLAFILVISAVSVPAQSQDPQNAELQVLKNKLEKLEQEMQELRRRLRLPHSRPVGRLRLQK